MNAIPESNVISDTNFAMIGKFVEETPLGKKMLELTKEFFELRRTNKIPRKYYGRNLPDTKTIKVLEEISNKFKGLRNYIFLNLDVHEYSNYAKTIAEALINAANKLSITELRKDIIESIIEDNATTFITIEYPVGEKKEAEKRYYVLKSYFNSTLNSMIKEIGREDEKQEVLKDETGNIQLIYFTIII